MNKEFEFAKILDKLKAVNRRTYTGDRLENTAEHSWHVAMLALIFGPNAPEGVSVCSAVAMLLIHDIPEIHVGDTFLFDIIHDNGAKNAKATKEAAAAAELFGLLPVEKSNFLGELWAEYEANGTPTAKFANAMDKLQPLFSQWLTQGRTWKNHGVSVDKIWTSLEPIKAGFPDAWPETEKLMQECIQNGFADLPNAAPEAISEAEVEGGVG